MDRLILEGIKVDAVITDIPYGTTACKWDSIIPFDEMWSRLRLLRKDRTPIVLFGNEPFSSALRMSNIKEYKYDWVWEKSNSTGFGNCNKMPMKKHEIVSLFYSKLPTYNPQKLSKQNKMTQRGNVGETMGLSGLTVGNPYIQKYTNYPTTVISGFKQERGLHPTQKPVTLMEYLIKTYTNEGDTVLDFTMGSGSTGVACKNLNRNFIGIELDEGYFNIAKQRIEER